MPSHHTRPQHLPPTPEVGILTARSARRRGRADDSPGPPVTSVGRPRVAALDVLRGVALCGILLANVKPIAHVGPALAVVAAPGPGDALPWLHLLVDQRFFPMFSLLFGVGFWLLFAGATARAARPRVALLRRLLVLLAMGLAHMWLVWPGDVLTMYAVVGLVVLLPATWLPRWAMAGLAAVLLAAALLTGAGWTAVIPGLFLLGAALARYGVVDRLESSTTVPATLGLACAAGAVPAARWQLAAGAGGTGTDHTMAMSLAGLLLAGVYVCAVLVLLRTPARPALTEVFAPLGRMALTNYVTQSVLVLATARVLGGVPDRWSSGTVLAVAGGVLAVQWVWSTLWLRRCRYGPLEWLWRWATWGRRPVLRHGSGASEVAAAAGSDRT